MAIAVTTEYYGQFVDLENGLVYKPAGKNRKALWVQCPTCGPQPPQTAQRQSWGRIALVAHTNTAQVASCSVCGRDGPIREALIPRERTRKHEKCSNKCLYGKHVCHCGCLGRCHGEGRCTCKEGSDA